VLRRVVAVFLEAPAWDVWSGLRHKILSGRLSIVLDSTGPFEDED